MKIVNAIIILLVLTIGIVGGAYFVLPDYLTGKLASESMSAGYKLLEEGDIAQGLSRVNHAINQAGGIEKLGDEASDGLVNALMGISSQYPLESNKIISFFDQNGLNPSCGVRLGAYNHLLRISVKNYKGNKSLSDMEEALYLAAAWGGTCKLGKKEILKFRKIFNFYKKKRGKDFLKSQWMEEAYAGKPISAASAATLQPASSAQPAKAPQANAAGAVATGAAAGAAARAPISKRLQPPIAGKLAEKKAPRRETVATPDKAPAEKQGFKEKITSKISSLFARGKGKIGKETPGKKKSAKSGNLAEKLLSLEADISGSLGIYGIKVTDLTLTEDAAVLYLTFESGYIKSKKLVEEIKTIFNVIHESVERAGGVPLKYLVISLKDPSGELRAKWDIEYADCKDYIDGKISGEQFRNKWRQEIL